MSQRLLIIILFSGTFSKSIAQGFEENNFKHFSTRNGLSNNYITGIEQDSTGYIWISTARGLNRFDGTTFKQFLHTDKSNSLPDNSIYSMQMFPASQLAIATDNGAQIIHTKTLNRKNLNIPTEEALQYWSNACRFVWSDKNGYQVSTKTGLYIFSSEGRLKKRYDRYTSKDIGKAWMLYGNRLYGLPGGNVLQQNSSGSSVYDHKKNIIADILVYYPALKGFAEMLKQKRYTFFFVAEYKILLVNSHKNSFDVIDIRNGSTTSFPASISLQDEFGWQTKPSRINENTWALNCKSKGFYLLHIDSTTGKVSDLSQKYFSNYFCSVIFSDGDKRLWIGSDGGIFMQNTTPPVVQTMIPDEPEKDRNYTIRSLHVWGNMLVIGTDKKQILIVDKQTGRLLKNIAVTTDENKIDAVFSFIRTHPDTLWVAAYSGLYSLDLKNFVLRRVLFNNQEKHLSPYKFFIDKKRRIWISSSGTNTVYTYHPGNGRLDSITKTTDPLLNINIATSFAEDKDGNIWIGGDAIARWNRRLQKIDTLIKYIPTQKNRKQGFTVMNDSDGEIWTSVHDDGYAKITGIPVHLRPSNLVHDKSSSIFPTLITDRIFVATYNGIGFLHTKNRKSLVFNDNDGVPQQIITNYQFCYDSTDKSIWVACKNLLTKFTYSDSQFTKLPVLNISELTIGNDSIIYYPHPHVSLRYFQNNIKVTLSAINYTDPKNMRFAYRIKNKKDTSWVDMGTDQNILLTSISPGNYQLQVKAYAYDNKWPEQIKEISIYIKPPFWKTAWFISIIALLIAFAIYYLYRRRVNQIQQRANLDKLLAQTEMKALHSQMNPHFIFNCLNSIREMILNDENREASHFLSKFAQLIRITLEQSGKTFISLHHTIDYLNRYIEMEQIRNELFTCRILADDELDTNEIFLPPMLIQPFIENALWHGITVADKKINVTVDFIKEENHIVCIIDDNGIGIEESIKNKSHKGTGHNSLGILNIQDRIRLLNEKYNLKYLITIEDKRNLPGQPMHGTVVTLRLPIKRPNDE